MNGDTESEWCVFESVVESDFEVKWQFAFSFSVFIGVESFELPSDISQSDTYLECVVFGLEVCSDICSERECEVVFIDGVDRFDVDSDGEHLS